MMKWSGRLIVFTCIALVVAGCGGSGEDTAPIVEQETEPVAQAPVQPDPQPEPAEAPEPEPDPEPTPEAPKGGVALGGLNIAVEPTEPAKVTTLPNSGIIEGVFTIEGNALVKASLLGPAGLTPGFGEDDSLRKLTEEWLSNIANALGDPPVIADEAALAASEDGSAAPQAPAVDENYGQVQAFEGDGATGYFVSAHLREAGVDGRAYIVNGYFNVGGAVVMLGGVHAGESEEAILDLVNKATWSPEDS